MIRSFTRYFDLFIKNLLFVCFISILILSVSTIFARWFQFSQQWIEPLIRHLVLLVAFLGGCLATIRGNHIAINLFEQRLISSSNKSRKTLHFIIHLVSLIVCLILVKVSISFTMIEFEYGQEGFLNIHSGLLVSIIPLGFSLLSLRFLLSIFNGAEDEELVKEWST